MQIVIDIPEDVYTRLFENGIQDNEIATDDICEMARALRLGTPLPKGHGKLKDVDKFLEKVKKDREHEIYLHSWTADMVLERLDSWYAPTIIEADKEYEVEVITRGNCMICGKELSDGIFFCKECEEKGRKDK